MTRIKNRKLISFSGICPLGCKHCYTYELDHRNDYANDKDEIKSLIHDIDCSEPFDVIYLSRKRENFVDEEAALNLIQQLIKRYKRHIFIITRQCLSDAAVSRLSFFTEDMARQGLMLAVAVSIPANDSYHLTEDIKKIATPEERCECIRRLHIHGIKTIFMARPLFPDHIIPVHEITNLIEKNAKYIDAVVASGLAVNSHILTRLQMSETTFEYLNGDNSEYLIGSEAQDIRYIDVSNELAIVADCCREHCIRFSTHSMEALNMLLDNNSSQ